MRTRAMPALWSRLFQLSVESGLGIQRQIRQTLVTAILDGQIPLDVALPSSRELASELKVARNTVVIAYQQLVDEGFLIARERSGFFINPDILAGRSARPATGESAPRAGTQWDDRFRFRPSAQRNIEKPANWQDYAFPFLYGQFDPSLFPTADWRECIMKVLSVMEIRGWAPDWIARDDPSLIQQIRTRVLPRRGVWAAEDEIVVTIGAQHALYLLADLLLERGVAIGMEDPGYPDARNIFASRTDRVVGFPVDEDGLKPSDALNGCDYLYLTPTHQCPTNVTLSLQRREALLDYADRYDVVLIEDDYESETTYSQSLVPALKSLDRNARVIYVGSLTKTFAPGLRLGYIVGPRELVAELRPLRRLMIRHPTAVIQRSFSLFLSLGHHDALLRRVAHATRERMQALTAAMSKYIPEISRVQASGGGSCWVRGPEWLDARQLAGAAAKRGVLIEPGDVFFMASDPPRNCFRMGLWSITLNKIEPGIVVLSEVMHGMKSGTS